MKKNTLYFGILVVIVVVAGFLLLGNTQGSAIQDTNKESSGENVQVVKMYVQGANYVFEPSTIKKGVPVRLEADMTRMPGCSRSFVASEWGIRKNFASNSNYVEFTPEKTGTFYVACSMNMYKGMLIVE